MNTSRELYFCHQCDRTVRPRRGEFICPDCGGGFIEPVESHSDQEDLAPEAHDPVTEAYGRMLVDSIGGAARSVRNPNLPRTHVQVRRFDRDPRGQAPRQHMFHMPFLNVGGAQASNAHSHGFAVDGLENMHFILQNLLGSPIHIRGFGGGGGSPGDYVHGPEAFDAVITQLLNQMEGTGPPPAPQDQINSIPRVTITQKHVDESLQCAVCFDDFSIGEVALKLGCEHCYHEACIKPWLEMHNSCPVCRKTIDGQPERGGAESQEPLEIDIDLNNTGPHGSSAGDRLF